MTQPFSAHTGLGLTPLRRASASLLLVTGMLGLPCTAYPLLYRQYAVAAFVGVSAVIALVAFRRLTHAVPYARSAATIAALAALVLTVDAISRTEIGKTGATRTVAEQTGLILLAALAGAVAAFAASFVKLRLGRFK
jgi:hypothetical protein